MDTATTKVISPAEQEARITALEARVRTLTDRLCVLEDHRQADLRRQDAAARRELDTRDYEVGRADRYGG